MHDGMIFETISGLPFPCLPGAHGGATIKADGLRFLDLTQAAARFGSTDAALRELYDAYERQWDTFREIHSPPPAGSVGEDEVDRLRRIKYPELSRGYVLDLVAFCDKFGFNAWSNHVWAEVRPGAGGEVGLQIMVRVEGLCARAHATGQFAGIDAPDVAWTEDGKPYKGTITIYRLVDGRRRPFIGEAYFHAYYPGAGANDFWDRMPEHMLGKCALAVALRLAFPDVLGGLVCPEEMDQARTRRPKPTGGGTAAGRAPASTAPAAEGDRAGEVDELPQDRTQLLLWMNDYGIRDQGRRESIVAEFRARYRHMGDAPMFYSAIAAGIRDNPAQYGAQAPAA